MGDVPDPLAPPAEPHRPSPPGGPARLVLAAARDNARWCGLVAASHGIAARTDGDAWSTSRRTPPGYPDAVTLRPGVDAASLLARIETTTPGASVKDSLADLDLSRHGFRELFAAHWIAHPNAPGTDREPAPGPDGPHWARVTDARTLSAWLAARGDPATKPVLLPSLLTEPDVTVLVATQDDDVVAGGVLTTGEGSVVGISNVFAVSTADPWAGILAWAAEHHRGRALVGYEHGDDLAAAVGHGFTATGPLRVWMALDADRAPSPGTVDTSA
jgi:hypothetical protein